MDPLLAVLDAHGVLAVFLVLFAKRMGVPVPALPFLLLAGARGRYDGLFALQVLAAGTLASVLADAAWFLAGRRWGRAMLGLMCRISLAPGSCIRQSELAFARRGAITVLFAKFVPGVAGLAPPLAGALGMRGGNFAVLNAAGTLLWVGSGLAAGLLLHRQVAQLLAALQAMGTAALPLLLLAIAGWLGWLALRRMLVILAAAKAPRVLPGELVELLARGTRVVLLDVRGAVATPWARIPGALHAAPGSDAFERLAALPAEAQLVTYCDCPNDLSAAHAALELRKRGLPARVLAGGLAGWRAAGLPVESVTGATALQEAREAAETPETPHAA